jgi:hypothetical protein
MRRRLVALVAAAAASACVGCGEDQSFSVDSRGGAAHRLDCIDRESLERDDRSVLSRQSLLRRLGSVRELQAGDYTVFASGPGGPSTIFDHQVPVPAAVRAGFVSWRHGMNTVNVVSHTATRRYMQRVLRCADFTPRARTPYGTLWRPGRERERIIIERRGILITGQKLPLLRKVAAATSSAAHPQAPAGWQALRRASGQAAGLSRTRSSCASFQLLTALSSNQLELAVGLPPGQRLLDVQAPRGVLTAPARQSRGTATLRADVANAERAVVAFAGVKQWSIACGS